MKKVLEYHGFEDLYDLERDISELFDARFNDEFKDLEDEFQNTVRITVEVLPLKEEDLG